MTWPSPAVAMLSSALVEMVDTEAESELALIKISSYIVWNDGVGGERGDRGDRRESMDTEELPTLLYQLLALTKKCEVTDRLMN
jgi:hypothetical protein